MNEMTTNHNVITMYDKIIDPIGAIEKMGDWFEQSQMFGCTQKGQGKILAMACIMEKRNPIEMTRTYHIIKGKLSMRADAMLAELRKAGGNFRWENDGEDGFKASIWVSYKENEGIVSFTRDEAQKAGLISKDGSLHTKYPGAMIRARAVSKAMRMYAPEIIAGYYTPEEIQDFDEPKNENNTGSSKKPIVSMPIKKEDNENIHNNESILNEVKNIIELINPKTDKEETKRLLLYAFSTEKWSHVTKMKEDDINTGIEKLKNLLKPNEQYNPEQATYTDQITPDVKNYMDELNKE